jgi:hypothetical protein
MTANIATVPTSVKLDAPLSDAEFPAGIEAVAQEIEHLERSATFKIANRLAWVHGQFLYRRDEGGFRGWVESRLGYSRTHAYRLLDVARLIKSVPGWDTFGTLPVTALYQLAAPSTSVLVRDQILDRLKTGERLSCAMVTEAIESAAAAAEREQNGAAPDVTESTEPTDDADDVAASTEARKEFNASAYRDDDGDADHDGDGGDAHHDDGDVGDHHVGDDDHVDGDRADRHDDGDDHAEEPKPAPPEPKAELETLAATWEMSTPEEQQSIRDRVLADFFAQATGADIAALIPTIKRAEVVRFLLDQLGVDAMLQAMSAEFGHQLRAKLQRKAKPFKAASARKAKPFKTANAVITGKETYAFQQGRGGRSRAH